MQYDRPIVISIAGFDPSGGAGVLADIKTFEQHHCQGMGVISALTVQTENHFISVEWMTAERIIEQLKPLLEVYECSFIKIGIIKDISTLQAVTRFIHARDKKIKIIWDTVLASSSGFPLMQDAGDKKLGELLEQVFLITPNADEIKLLTKADDEMDSGKLLSAYCHVLLKGGHRKSDKGTDLLFQSGSATTIKGAEGNYFEKHGSGCILSSAITACLAKGESLESACSKAKSYIEKILNSNEHLLAYHVQ
jgi:hydroxymethylpyrimidine/phosphomethylpyrimidine kinase